jgi:hypothetical protein
LAGQQAARFQQRKACKSQARAKLARSLWIHCAPHHWACWASNAKGRPSRRDEARARPTCPPIASTKGSCIGGSTGGAFSKRRRARRRDKLNSLARNSLHAAALRVLGSNAKSCPSSRDEAREQADIREHACSAHARFASSMPGDRGRARVVQISAALDNEGGVYAGLQCRGRLDEVEYSER